jgi:UDP-glucose 4-epimerase
MQRVAITGSSGYYGRKMIEYARRELPGVKILGIDVVAPKSSPPDEFVPLDIRDPEVQATLAKFEPDTIVHLAFVVNPTHNDQEMHEINVGGTLNVFAAVRSIQPQRFLLSSSATAYGAWPDNPIPMNEDWPLRARENFQYSADKTAIEHLIRDLKEELPEVAIAWTRPAIIACGEVQNYLSKLVLYMRCLILPDGHDSPLQFVHVNDCVAATWLILQQSACGPFNVAPPDWLKLTEIARLTNRGTIKLPLWSIRLATTIWWTLRLPLFEFPPSLYDFVRHPWIVAPTRLQRELGFQFRYSTADTVLEMWQAFRRQQGYAN